MANLKSGPKPVADSTGKYDQRYRDRKGNGSDNSKVRPAK